MCPQIWVLGGAPPQVEYIQWSWDSRSKPLPVVTITVKVMQSILVITHDDRQWYIGTYPWAWHCPVCWYISLGLTLPCMLVHIPGPDTALVYWYLSLGQTLPIMLVHIPGPDTALYVGTYPWAWHCPSIYWYISLGMTLLYMLVPIPGPDTALYVGTYPWAWLCSMCWYISLGLTLPSMLVYIPRQIMIIGSQLSFSTMISWLYDQYSPVLYSK